MAVIDPSPDAMAQVLADAERLTGPVRMVNLLRFRDVADYGDLPDPAGDAGPSTGAEAYGRYGEVAFAELVAVGAKPVYYGRADQLLVGPPDEHWDVVAIIEYPDRAAFLAMLQRPTYLAAVHHRLAGLADTRLIATSSF